MSAAAKQAAALSPAESQARRARLAHLHCLRRDAGWSDDEYRTVLEIRTGKRSAADLDLATLGKLVDDLAPLIQRRPGDATKPAKPARARVAGDWCFIDKASDEKRPLLRKIFATCRALGAGRTYAEGVAKRQSGGLTRRLEMMSYEELHKVAAALSATQRSKLKAAREAAAGPAGSADAATPATPAAAPRQRRRSS